MPNTNAPAPGTSEGQDTSGSTNPLKDVDRVLSSANLAPLLSSDVLSKMSIKVIEEYKIDKKSRKEWEDQNEIGIELATQVIEEKQGDYPFPGASNIKYPTLSMASVQFAARAYPQLFKGIDIVKGRVVGKDEGGVKAKLAIDLGQHMSWQILEEMNEWEDDTDSLLTALPIEGCEFKKTFYCPSTGKNASSWVRPSDLVINFHAKSLERAPRLTHRLLLYPNEIFERVRSGVFAGIKEFNFIPELRDEEEDTHDQADEQAPHMFYEQHRYWDVDGDGYSEPVIITVHRDSQKIVRVMPRYDVEGMRYNSNKQLMRIDPVHYFTRYLFLPCPKGGIYGMGFGKLLGPINMSINMTINQLHDAGTLANTQGGFIGKGFTPGKGKQPQDLEFEMGEFKQVQYSGDDIRKSIMPLPFQGPNPSLFQLLGMLIEAGEKLGSVTDPMLGQSPGANVPATTTLALIEQGGKVFSSVFKRLFRGFKKEFEKLYRLNSLYLKEEAYYLVMDDPKSISREVYRTDDMNVVPVADPNMVSETQQLLKAEIMKGFMGMGLNDDEIVTYALEAMRIPDWERFIPDEKQESEPDPKTVMEMMKLDLEHDKLDLAMFEAQAKVVKMHADAILSLAKAEAAEIGPQIELYTAQMQALTERFKARMSKEGRGDANKAGSK